MILDERTEFCDAVSIAAAAGTALIGDVIDLTSLNRDLGAADELVFIISVDTEITTAAGAGTVRFLLVSDAQAAIAIDGSATVHYDSGTFVTNVAASNDPLLNAGGIPVQVTLPLQGKVYERYLGVLVITATTTTNAGAISAYLTPDKHTNPAKFYAEGVN